jgi:hypothetical protein
MSTPTCAKGVRVRHHHCAPRPAPGSSTTSTLLLLLRCFLLRCPRLHHLKNNNRIQQNIFSYQCLKHS